MTEEEEEEAADEKESPVAATAGFCIDPHSVGAPCTEKVGFGT
jgi:hypothetical protein